LKRGSSLTTRAFLLSFIPVCLVLTASFVALNAVVEQRVKEGLRDSLQKSEDLVNRANADYSRRLSQFVSVLAESAGLKAAIGLLHEAPATPESAAEIRRTIEAQLREMHQLVGYDLLAVTDWNGRTLASVEFRDGGVVALEQMPDIPEQGALLDSRGVLYELTTTPINIGGEQIADLRLGSKFDLSRYHLAGQMALLENGKILRSTFPPVAWAGIEEQLRGRCGQPRADCEIGWNGETLLVLPVHEALLGPSYRLLEFRSLDQAVREFTSGWISIILKVGCVGVLLALLFTLATARSVSKPLRDLVAQLRSGEEASQFPQQISAGQAVGELRLLAETFNRVAARERRSREEIEKARVAAEAASRAKSEFLTTISHELRTPMNGVIGLTELLLETKLDSEQRDFAKTVRSSAGSLLVIINDILDFSRIDAGRLVLADQPFDLRQLIEEIITLLAAEASYKGLNLRSQLSPNVPTCLIGDAVRMRQILTNLVGNAIKFTERGKIDLRVECEGSTSSDATLRLSVADTGIGIPADKLEVIFEKFTQADGSLSRRFGGTGLGLAITKQLVELMGGTLGVESRVGVGSTFWIVLRLSVGTEEFVGQQPGVGEAKLC